MFNTSILCYFRCSKCFHMEFSSSYLMPEFVDTSGDPYKIILFGQFTFRSNLLKCSSSSLFRMSFGGQINV